MTMRDATPRELHQLGLGRCPLCSCDQFHAGPRGGAAQNYECSRCGARFNVTIVGRSILFAQSILGRRAGSDWTEYYKAARPRPLFAQQEKAADNDE